MSLYYKGVKHRIDKIKENSIKDTLTDKVNVLENRMSNIENKLIEVSNSILELKKLNIRDNIIKKAQKELGYRINLLEQKINHTNRKWCNIL